MPSALSKPPSKPGVPRLTRKPKQRMAVVVTCGDPNVVMPQVMPALYGSVYKLRSTLKKAGKDPFKVGALVARWPDAHLHPKDQWTGVWGLAIPASTRALPQRTPEIRVRIETWEYGNTVAEILHVGPFSEEGPAVQRLQEFIAESGYEIAGAHEEEYLTSPKARVQKTIIRYPVHKRKHPASRVQGP